MLLGGIVILGGGVTSPAKSPKQHSLPPPKIIPARSPLENSRREVNFCDYPGFCGRYTRKFTCMATCAPPRTQMITVPHGMSRFTIFTRDMGE
jgi:hypothetical protein